MKFSCTQENLNQALGLVSHITGKNVTLPILQNILIRAKDGLITFLATNLEVGVTYQVRGKVEADGEFTVPGKVLADYVGLLPKDRVDVVLDGTTLLLSCDSYKTKIKGEVSSEYPIIPQVVREQSFGVLVEALLSALQQVTFSAAMSESRPEISGVLFWLKPNEQKLVLAATDSYRLAERTIPLTGTGEEKRVIIPVRTLQELQRMLTTINRAGENDATNLALYFHDNQVLFVCDQLELVSRVIDGQYPDYVAIIPTTSPTEVVVSTQDILKAVKSASLFAQSGINDISLRCLPEGKLIVSSVNTQVGENTSSLTAAVGGPEQTVVLNYRYVIDGLNVMTTPEVVFGITDNNNPVMIKPTIAGSNEPSAYQYLIMPIKQ